MEPISTELSRSNLNYQVPIEEFQGELSILAEEKKEKVIDLLKNNSNIDSSKQFEDMKQILGLAIRRFDLELINILLMKEITKDGMKLKIDTKNNTASLFDIINSDRMPIDFTVPRSINHEMKEYIITSIISSSIDNSKLISSLHFSNDSEVHTIYENSFYNSKIKSLFIPKNMRELRDGWCCYTNHLTNITISPDNKNFIYKDNQFLLGKTDPKSDNFNVLLFARRDLTKAIIPSNVTVISASAFDGCSSLRTIEIQSDSQLKKIGRNAFSYSIVSSIYFPSSLSELEEEWQIGVTFEKIEISQKNKNFIYKDDQFLLGKTNPKSDKFNVLIYSRRDIKEAIIPSSVEIISNNAFDGCRYLEKVSIPASVSEIGFYAFYRCDELKNVEFSNKSQLKYIGKHAFFSTGLAEISIPKNVITIDDLAFANCVHLGKLTIDKNSKLKTVGKYAFTMTCIEHFYIPPCFDTFGEGWNFDIKSIYDIEISPLNKNFKYKDNKFLLGKTDRQSDNFDILIAARLDLEEVCIPPNIKIISPLAFSHFELLRKVQLPAKSKLEMICESAFEKTQIKEIDIPSKVRIIGEKAFYNCKNLRDVNITVNSQLEKIGRQSFENTIIERINIPSKVSHIFDKAFFNCNFLQYVDISDESRLKMIDESSFAFTDLSKMKIPNEVLKIGNTAFSGCENLEIIEIGEESKLLYIGEYAFASTSIKNIYIPRHVKMICAYAFNYCTNLTNIEIPANSELLCIDKCAFCSTKINKIFIPEHLIELSVEGFSINEITISPKNNRFIYKDNQYLLYKTNPKSDNYDVLLYTNSECKQIYIPSNAKPIASHECSDNESLKNVEVNQNSELKNIDESSFGFSVIEKLQSELSMLTEEKKEKVIDLLKNNSNIDSSKQFEDMKQILGLAIRRFDLELINILLMKEITKDGMKLKIDTKNNTASLFDIINSDRMPIDFTVPRSINHEMKEYIITSIISSSIDNSKLISSLHFSNDSEVHTIYENSFYNSKIKSLFIPKNMRELRDGWCCYTNHLTNITISPDNKNFIYKDNQFLLGKTDPKSDNFNVLLFARRDLTKAIIPSNVTVISASAFDGCSSLRTIEIQSDSQLKKIGRNAFSYSIVSSIYFPSSLSELEEEWQIGVTFEKIEISQKNKNFIYKDDQFLLGKTNPKSDKFNVLIYSRRDIKEAIIPSSVEIISNNAFDGCRYLEKVSIPASVSEIGFYAFYRCDELKNVEFSNKSQLKYIGKHAFFSTGLAEISIPKNVITIDDLAFANCVHLGKLTIDKNSKLKTVGKYAFTMTCIEHFYIPPCFDTFGEGWNFDIKSIYDIEISPLNKNFKYKDNKFLLGKTDRQSDNFDILIAARLDLEEVCIPPNIKIISPLAFSHFELLRKVQLPAKSKLEMICESAFEKTQIKEIDIPSKVRIIGEKAFYNCKNLRDVNITVNSQLEKIGRQSFENTIIERINIPSKVSHIFDKAFFNCNFLQYVDISDESRLKMIDESSFAFTDLSKMKIPNEVLKIGNTAFSGCENLEIIEIGEESKLLYIGEYAFASTSIKNIYIPRHVKMICAYAFNYCTNLTNIEIPANSELLCIDKCAFCSTKINKIFIPEHLIELSVEGFSINEITISPKNNRFIYKDNQYLLYKTNPKSDNYDVFVYANFGCKQIDIPSSIKSIVSHACDGNRLLKSVIVNPNSELRIIGESSFSLTNIEKFFIPKNLLTIESYAFSFCKKLHIIYGLENSDIQKIGDFAFSNTNLNSLIIPSTVSELGHNAFNFCFSISIIEFSENNLLKSVNKSQFQSCGNLIVMIPVSMVHLINEQI